MQGIKKFSVTEKYIKVVYLVNDNEVTIKWILGENDPPEKLLNSTNAYIGILEETGKHLFEKAGK